MILARLLNRNLKKYYYLVVLAVLVTIAQVGCDLLAAMPLKFIPSKVNNPGADPACTFQFLDPVLLLFDTPALDSSLRPIQPNQPPGTPPPAPCPANPSDPNSIIHPMVTHHSVVGVIVFSLLMLLVFGLLSAFLSYVELTLATFISQQLSARLREELFDHLQRLSLDWHDKQKKGDLVQRVTGNIADIEKLVTDGLVDLLAGSLTLLGVAIIMSFISVSYTALSLTIAPLLFLLVFAYTGGIKLAARQKSKAAGKIADVATEDINALTVIRAFALERRENRRFGTYVDNHRVAGLRAGNLQAQFTPLVAILVVLGTLLVLGVGGYVAAGNSFNLLVFTIPSSTIDVGTLILFLTYLKMLYQPMRDLSKLTNIASNASSGAERIQEVLDQAPEVIETNTEYHGPQRLQGDISFEDVYFGYIKDRPILKGISLSIPAGRKVALVGYSGSGKTTLVKLIPRFYEIMYGSLKIDGVDIRKYPLQVLRNNISLVLQDSVMFEGTIRENLEIGRPGAALEEIVLAAKKANIHDVINKLPDGYDTLVREQGSNFSAGQRQRLAIARAILRDTPILILDEPTANLDVESEAEVMHALNTLISGRTVFTISHRLSTLGKVDEIIVMSNGNIVEHGSFQYLKRLGGTFANLLEEQNRYNLDREDETMIVRAASIKTSALNERAKKKEEQKEILEPISDQLVPLSSADLPISDQLTMLTPAELPLSEQLTMLAPTQRLNPEKKVPVPDRSFIEEITVESPAIKSITSHMTAHLPNAQNLFTSKHRFISNAGLPSDKKNSSPDKARVYIQIDGKPAGEYILKAPSMKIGRRSDCEIQISSPRVSRHHAVLRWSGQGWVIEDADSLNGLTWRGYRITQMVLSNGNRVYLDPNIVLQYKEDR